MNIDFSEWSQNIKIFMSHEKAHPKATLAEEGTNTWVNKITCVSYNFPIHACSYTIQYEQSTMVSRMEATDSLRNTSFH